MDSFRTIIEEDSVVEKLAEISKLYPRVEDLFDALKWRLARKPEDGIPILKPDFLVIKTDLLDIQNGSVPVIRVLYSFTEDQVNIYAVAIVDMPAGDID